MTADNDAAREQAVSDVLAAAARARTTILYRDLAQQAGVQGPQTIHKTVMTLEALVRRDHAAGRPLLAAAAIGKIGIPRPGFFQLVRQLGIYDGPDEGPAAETWHKRMLARLYDHWAGENPGGAS